MLKCAAFSGSWAARVAGRWFSDVCGCGCAVEWGWTKSAVLPVLGVETGWCHVVTVRSSLRGVYASILMGSVVSNVGKLALR